MLLVLVIDQSSLYSPMFRHTLHGPKDPRHCLLLLSMNALLSYPRISYAWSTRPGRPTCGWVYYPVLFGRKRSKLQHAGRILQRAHCLRPVLDHLPIMPLLAPAKAWYSITCLWDTHPLHLQWGATSFRCCRLSTPCATASSFVPESLHRLRILAFFGTETGVLFYITLSSVAESSRCTSGLVS